MADSKVTKGDSGDSYLMGSPQGAIPTGVFANNVTTPLISSQDDTSDVDGFSLQLIVDFQQDQVAVIAGTDAVVASTGVWTFGNYTFTGMVGNFLVVSGAANSGNNGVFAITVVSGHTATTATTGLINETFGAGVSVLVLRADLTPSGLWTIQGSNDFTGAGASRYGQIANLGHWSDITSLFSTPATIAPVVAPTGTQFGSHQIVQVPNHLSVRHYRATFTPSSGAGTARVVRFGKSWSR